MKWTELRSWNFVVIPIVKVIFQNHHDKIETESRIDH